MPDLKIQVYPKLSPRVIQVIPEGLTSLSVQDIYDAVQEWMQLPHAHSIPPLIVAEGKAQLGGGVQVGITAICQNAKLRIPGETVPLEDGTCTSNDTTGKTLIASGGDFINSGVYPGCTVINWTTRSMASVIEVVSPTELLTFKLSGGSRLDWQVNDEYVVYPNVQYEIAGGNFVAIDENGDEMSPIYQSPNIQIILTRASSATQSDIEAIQYASYQNGVWYDPNSSNSGTNYPVGNHEYPVNNLPDAVSIAILKGFSTIYITKSTTIDGIDIRNFKLVGSSHVHTLVTLADATQCDNVTIENCNVTGVLDGGTHVIDCMCGNLTYVNGHIHNSGLYGLFLLGGSADAVFSNCYTCDENDLPIIDMGGSGRNLCMPNYSGFVTIRDLSGVSDKVTIGLNSGEVVLEDTITGGTIVISGVGNLNDSSGGTTLVDSSALLNSSNVAFSVWNAALNASHDSGSMGAAMIRLMGLIHENSFIDNTTYDGAGNMISARLRCFDSKTNADGATDGGSGESGELVSYSITAEYEDSHLKQYRMTLEP